MNFVFLVDLIKPYRIFVNFADWVFVSPARLGKKEFFRQVGCKLAYNENTLLDCRGIKWYANEQPYLHLTRKILLIFQIFRVGDAEGFLTDVKITV